MLAAAFATQQVALTAIYLERLRELVVGGSELLPITETFTKSKRRKVESELRAGLRDVIDRSTKLDEDQKKTLQQSLQSNSGKIATCYVSLSKTPCSSSTIGQTSP